QMANRVEGKGTGILDLARLYIHEGLEEEKTEQLGVDSEEVLARVREGGEVTEDLRVIYWQDPSDLARKLVKCLAADMEADTGEKLNPERAWELWTAAFRKGEWDTRPEYSQVLSPYRGEEFGTEALNLLL